MNDKEGFLYVSYPNCLCRTAKCITGKESCLFGLLCYLKVAIIKWVVSVTVSSFLGADDAVKAASYASLSYASVHTNL